MCTDVDYLPRMMVLTEQHLLLPAGFARKSSWSPSVSSASPKINSTSWLERKLFSHFKRFFRRSSFASSSNSSVSSRRTSSVDEEKIIAISPVQQPLERSLDELVIDKHEPLLLSSASSPARINEQAVSIVVPAPSPPVDSLYDYTRLLARCTERQESYRNEMIIRSQAPVTIPHADLAVDRTRSVLRNWKSYVRLCRALNRDPQLFQQYVNQSYVCQSSINSREQMIFTVRTSKATFDNVLRTFLDEYVTCLECQKAQTHLIKTTSSWRVECQLCGSQRTAQRLRRKR